MLEELRRFMIANIRYPSPAELNDYSVSKDKKSLDHMIYAAKQVSDISDSLAEDKVSISKAAISAYRDKQTENTNDSGNRTMENSINDNFIESITKQIEALKQEINQIRYDKSKAAQRTKKMLQFQLNTLNASLMDLLGKKLLAL